LFFSKIYRETKMKKLTVLFFVSILLTAITMAQTPQYYNYQNVGSSSNTFPFGQSAGKAVEWLILAGDLNQPSPLPSGMRITKVYFYCSSGGSRTYTNLHVLMAQTDLTTLTTGQFYPGPMDTVYYHASATLTATTNNWFSIELDRPFVYNPTKSLVVFVGQCAGPGSGMYVRQNVLANIRRVWSVGGCPFVPYAGGDGSVVNFGVDVEPVAPTHYNYNATGGDNSFPLNIAGGKMVQWLVAPGEYNQPTPALGGGKITGLYFRISGTYPLGPATYIPLVIRMGQTALTSLTTGQFYSGTMDTVFRRDTIVLQQPVNSWLYFPLDVEYAYNPGLSLVIEMGQCGATGTTSGFSLTHTTVSGNRRVWSVGGCPFIPYASAGTNVVNNGIDIEYPLGVTPPNEIPGAYRLEQNYPNPFNPVTSISFSIPKSGIVKIAVYDVVGREVTVILNEHRTAGSYTVPFDAENFASGVYLYKMTSGGFTETKKMTLIK
jgi:Ni,Fe-hydrogenase III small subunit